MTETDRISRGSGGADVVDVRGYVVRLDREYHPPTHLWVLDVGGGHRRVGLDALSAETYGRLAQLVLPPVGRRVEPGDEVGSLEAAKFVGPLVSPLHGIVRAVNAAVLEDPDLAVREPYDGGWLLELELDPGHDRVPGTVAGDRAVAWYESAVAAHCEIDEADR
jgi:glycine cleavage system H protein